ncbi:MAG: hypothetical protein QXX12_06070 [Nanopusillaceae archaeon]
MKEFHIISCGHSILTNAQKAWIIAGNIRIADENYWKKLLEDQNDIKKLKNFLREDPRKNSAELNTFLRVVEDKEPKDMEVYLFETKTYSNKLRRRVLELFFFERIWFQAIYYY